MTNGAANPRSLEHINALRFADAEPWEKGNDDSTS